jgi:hypothetical protein
MGQYVGVEAGGWPGKHTEAGCAGSRFTINPTLVEAKATIPRWVWESMPTEYGNGGTLAGVVGAVDGINVLRSILPRGVAEGAAGGVGIWKIHRLRSA